MEARGEKVVRARSEEYERHCTVIDFTDWSPFNKKRIKDRIWKVLKRDGFVDYKAFPPEYRWNLCAARLKGGDLTNWDGWEFRSDWAMTFAGFNGFETHIPKWDGTRKNHIVVLGEQGIGDEILFLSALPDLMVRVGTKTLEYQTYPRLRNVIERSFRIKTTERKPLGEITEGDALIAVADLFQWYRMDVSHFPRKPFLKPDPEKIDKWKSWLSKFDGKKIGLSWFSRHGFLKKEDLMTENGVYFNLQYGKQGLEGLVDVPFDVKNDVDDLFAFVNCLDSVHSVTQTLVHVAGSIGKDCKAVIPPRNGEVTWYLWYHSCKALGGERSWNHLVYPSVRVYEDIDEFRNRSPE